VKLYVDDKVLVAMIATRKSVNDQDPVGTKISEIPERRHRGKPRAPPSNS
jgi:hypothetical protein